MEADRTQRSLTLLTTKYKRRESCGLLPIHAGQQDSAGSISVGFPPSLHALYLYYGVSALHALVAMIRICIGTLGTIPSRYVRYGTSLWNKVTRRLVLCPASSALKISANLVSTPQGNKRVKRCDLPQLDQRAGLTRAAGRTAKASLPELALDDSCSPPDDHGPTPGCSSLTDSSAPNGKKNYETIGAWVQI